MFRKSTLAASAATFSLCAALLPAGVSAQTLSAQEAAELFGARANDRHVSLSPDGTKFSYIAPLGAEGEILYSVDLTAETPVPKRVIALNQQRSNLDFCEWATNTRFVCRTSFTRNLASNDAIVGLSRIFAVDEDGSNVEQLTQTDNAKTLYTAFSGGSVVALDVAGEQDKILMTQDWFPEDGRNTRIANKEWGRGVVEIDINSAKRSKVESPDDNTMWYMADDTGAVRLKGVTRSDAGNRDTGNRAYFYREKGSSRWQELSRAEFGLQNLEEGFTPSAIDSASDSVYGFMRNPEGFLALYRLPLDGSDQFEEVVSRDDVDVDGLIRLGRKDRVVGASYATEVREAVYFDPELKTLADGLNKALPGNPLIGIRAANADESRLLISASSDTDPGILYLYDKQTRQLNELMPLRDGFAGRQLGTMKPITYSASDGTSIPGYLTLPPGKENARGLPAIVMPHGGPSSRDEWGFDWLVQFFATRGYAVLQPNFRGSAGYGEAWFGENGYRAWRTAIGDVNDAGRWLIGEGVADPSKLAIVGWSYGGYAALQSQILDNSLYKAIAAIAPVTEFRMMREDRRNYWDYRLRSEFMGEGEHLVTGSPARNADQFASPVLLFHGDADQNVDVTQSREMERELRKAGKSVKYVEFEDIAHGIDNSVYRAQMLSEIDSFLRTNLGG